MYRLTYFFCGLICIGAAIAFFPIFILCAMMWGIAALVVMLG